MTTLKTFKAIVLGRERIVEQLKSNDSRQAIYYKVEGGIYPANKFWSFNVTVL